MKRGIFLFCILSFFISNTFAQKDNPDIKSQAALIFNAKNERVIYDKNADKVMPIASITKLMTAMVTLDARLSPARMSTNSNIHLRVYL